MVVVAMQLFRKARQTLVFNKFKKYLKIQIYVEFNVTVFKNLIIKVLETLRNFRKPLSLYKCMKKWYIPQAFSIFSTRYKK